MQDHGGFLLSLYKTSLKEANRLPYRYLRLFFRIKLRNDFQPLFSSKQLQSVSLISSNKMKRLKKTLKVLTNANEGRRKAFSHVLDLAYGRTGKLWWELMEPLRGSTVMRSTSQDHPATIVLRDPDYPLVLRALISSTNSRSGKALKAQHIDTPLALQNASELSFSNKICGSLNPRRRHHIIWRHYALHTRRILPPLEIIGVNRTIRSHNQSLAENEVTEYAALQGARLNSKLHEMVRPVLETFDMGLGQGTTPTTSSTDKASSTTSPRLPTRFLRRRHQELMSRLPLVRRILTSDRASKHGVRYEISLPKHAISAALHYSPHRLVKAGENELAWWRLYMGQQ